MNPAFNNPQQRGLSNLAKSLRNPMLIHRIQDGLIALKGEDLLSYSFKEAAKEKPSEVCSTILSCYEDNPKLIRELLGNELLSLIFEYLSYE